MGRKPTYALGELIKIVKRKCSDKIQPKIKEGGLYLVLEEEKPTKSGAKCVRIIEFSKAAEVFIVNPTEHINPKDTMKCNADRFEWVKKSKGYLKAEFEKIKNEYFKKQEQLQDKQIQDKFTDRERVQLAYTPYLYAELAWHYANKVRLLSVERRVEKFKKQTRTIRELRDNFTYELKKKMSQPVLEAAQGKVKKAIEDQSVNFFKFELSVQNEINRQFVKVDNDDIKAYAYISMLCYKSQRKIDMQNARMISKRVGGVIEDIDSYKYMRELNDCMSLFMDGCQVKENLAIETSVKILENNINSMHL